MKSKKNRGAEPAENKAGSNSFRRAEETAAPAQKKTSEAAAQAAEKAKPAAAEEAEEPSVDELLAPPRKRRTGLKVLLVVLGVVFLLVAFSFGYIWHKLSLIQYESNEPSVSTAEISFSTDENQVIVLPDDHEENLPTEPTTEPTTEVETTESKPDIADPSVSSEPVSSESAAADTTAADTQQGLSGGEVADINKDIKDVSSGELMHDDKVFNILLLGVDSTSDYTRTDSMILVSINHRTGTIHMNSLMRDLYVHIPGRGYTRLNAANVFGGPNLLLDTVEENFRIKVDYYALVNLRSMARIIDIMGGVQVTVKDYEVSQLNHLINAFNSISGEARDSGLIPGPGTYNMNGKQAVSYSRIRYAGNSDYERTSRQRRVLTSLFNKMRSAGIGQINSMADAVLPQVKTNLSMGEVAGLLAQAPSIMNYSIDSGRVPISGAFRPTFIRGMAVLVPNLRANIDYLSQNIYGYTYSAR